MDLVAACRAFVHVAEATMARVARDLHDYLRSTG